MHTSFLRTSLLCLSLLGASLLSGCFLTTACPAVVTIPVTVQVVDAAGAPVTDAVVQYAVDNGAKKDCENPGSAGDSYRCGSGEAGKFTITVTSKDGSLSKSASVTVTKDECGVVGESVTITLS